MWQEDEKEDVSSYWMILRKKRGYWKLKDGSLDRSLCRNRFGRGYEPIVKQTTEWMKEGGSGRVSPLTILVFSQSQPTHQRPTLIE
jgi:hypothetical protein